jgi:hypothetical protein
MAGRVRTHRSGSIIPDRPRDLPASAGFSLSIQGNPNILSGIGLRGSPLAEIAGTVMARAAS